MLTTYTRARWPVHLLPPPVFGARPHRCCVEAQQRQACRGRQQAAARLLQAAETGSLAALHDLVDREHDALATAHHRATTTTPMP